MGKFGQRRLKFFHRVNFLFKDECEPLSRSLFECIENFPDELLIEIFTYLSVIDLKRVTLTSRVFNDIVGQSSKLMKKFLTKIAPNKKWDFESLAMFERKHQSVKLLDFKCDDGSIELLADGLLNIGSNIKHFEVNDSEISAENLVAITNTMEHLTNVCLINIKVSGEVPVDLKLPEFRSLTHLKIIKSDTPFDIFNQAQLLSEIFYEADNCKSLNLAGLEIILHNSRRLKTLALINIRFRDFLEDKNFPFQLKSLTIHQCYIKQKENLENFLEMQCKLEEVDITIDNMKLKLDHARYFDDSLCFIVSHKTLRKITLDIDNYNFVNVNFLRHYCNENVKHLKLNLVNTTLAVTSILRVFPNIDSLELSIKEIDQESIDYINENLQSLRELKVSKFPNESFGKLKLNNLTSLNVNETNLEFKHWMEFLVNHLKITKLIINFTFFMDLSEDFIDEITKKLKLEHLELIDKWVGLSNEIYVKICENTPSLKYLKLWNINVEKDFDDHDKEYLRSRNIKFHLYNDESLNTPMVPF